MIKILLVLYGELKIKKTEDCLQERVVFVNCTIIVDFLSAF